MQSFITYRGWAPGKLDRLEEYFSYKEFQFLKNVSPACENVNKTPEINDVCWLTHDWEVYFPLLGVYRDCKAVCRRSF